MRMREESRPPLTYLAAPYRHHEELVRDARLEAVSRVAAGLTKIDRRVFCPLTYADALLENGFGPRDDEWWYGYDIGWLSHCAELVVLMLPGWTGSDGVRMEIQAAERRGIAISYMEPPEQYLGLTSEQSDELRNKLSGPARR